MSKTQNGGMIWKSIQFKILKVSKILVSALSDRLRAITVNSGKRQKQSGQFKEDSGNFKRRRMMYVKNKYGRKT